MSRLAEAFVRLNGSALDACSCVPPQHPFPMAATRDEEAIDASDGKAVEMHRLFASTAVCATEQQSQYYHHRNEFENFRRRKDLSPTQPLWMMFHRALILLTATDVALLEDSIKLSRYEVLTRLEFFVSQSLVQEEQGYQVWLSRLTICSLRDLFGN